ncbi:hypothetical protein WICPIJ_007167 [Wickerhamomyces pijperi]|uniref:Uncharacterized protein n=1 Tax=Wickerhamomyces pijperi TaxID=599730 RepID=A0A9P8TKP3_WICPI|nr:hypothetical protein WICPIJ_007167 [Wickerhamomyces pijperi]
MVILSIFRHVARAENFFFQDGFVLGNVIEYGWFNEIALITDTFTTGQQLGLLGFLTQVNVFHNGVELFSVCDGALEVLRVEWRANFDVCFDVLLEQWDEFVIDCVLDSSNTICGDLPPNSKVTFFKFEDWADLSRTCFPTFVEPVKEILEI